MSRTSMLVILATVVSGLLLGFLGAIAASRMGVIGSSPGPVAETTIPETREGETAPSAPPRMEPGEDSPPPMAAEDETVLPVVVSVCGAVKRAGTYRFDEDKRVNDAIRAAGGLLPEADLDDINIAARLIDNTTLYLPFKVFSQRDSRALVARRTPTAAEMNPGRYTRSGWTGVTAEPDTPVYAPVPIAETTPVAKPPSTPGGLIDLNHASLQELQELPGIGPKTAEKIIAYRESTPFQRIDDLMEVHGIGDKKMEAVRNLVTVGQTGSP